jgi:hypothetical protein
MEIKPKNDTIEIYGNIKSETHFHSIKMHVDDIVARYNRVRLELIDSISLTSSVIGYLTRIALKDGKRVELHVGDDNVIELLRDLGLIDVFSIQKRNFN